jgi:SlyX protein
MTSTADSSTEAAIADLQSRVAFQEDTLQSLNKIIAAQDASIAKLQQQLQVLNRKVMDLAEAVEHKPMSVGDEPPPPHY